MIIRTMKSYSDAAKMAEIMSRYRPIAPKPDDPSHALDGGSSLTQNIRQCPYLRNPWPQLQTKQARIRKRGRAPLSPPSFNRQRTQLRGYCTPYHVKSPANSLSLQGFAHGVSPQLMSLHDFATVNIGMEKPIAVPSLVTLPLLPCSSTFTITTRQPTIPELGYAKQREAIIDLNCTAVQTQEQNDLTLRLQGPTVCNNVIAPQPVRPIGSSISIGCINEGRSLTQVLSAPKKLEEVEVEVESEALPAVLSDSNHRVRMANSAYKEMVGQPECPWLDTMTANGRKLGGSCKRISGEVVLHLCDSKIPMSSNGFSCMVRIDWDVGGKRSSITALCDVVRLFCESRNYVFTWRFHVHTRLSIETAPSSCNI